MAFHLENIDWHRFLARRRIDAPVPEMLRSLGEDSILVTGAGGSIGSSLAQRLADLSPRQLILLEASESHLFALRRMWSQSGKKVPANFLLGSIADRALLEETFALHMPRLVFHAAAFKHVPLLEEHPLAAISNNICGTQYLVSTALKFGARVVLLSTDKAVEPSSVMGATKRVAEQIVLAAGGTVLRLGNVLASRDSVAEVFAGQIAEGGPITVTDPAARRYFLTLEEAVNLLLAAALHPDTTALLAPDLDKPHYIADLAQFMASEVSPGREIKICFTQPRPGDKEAEQLWPSHERVRHTTHPGLLSVHSPFVPNGSLHNDLSELRAALDARDTSACLVQLCRMVPDYQPSPALQSIAVTGSAGLPR